MSESIENNKLKCKVQNSETDSEQPNQVKNFSLHSATNKQMAKDLMINLVASRLTDFVEWALLRKEKKKKKRRRRMKENITEQFTVHDDEA